MNIGRISIGGRLCHGNRITHRDWMNAYCPSEPPYPALAAHGFRARFGVNRIFGFAVWVMGYRLAMVLHTNRPQPTVAAPVPPEHSAEFDRAWAQFAEEDRRLPAEGAAS